MNFMDNYDNILNSALDTEKNAECCIDRRVDDWAHHSMISAEQGQELKSCIAKFYNKTKKIGDVIKKSRKMKTTLSAEKLTGWECGLCQMIDITNKDVCELLPFLLTAYIYNFPKNQFVSCYLEVLKKRKKKYDYTDDWFCGLDIPEFESDDEFQGIGKLLNLQMDDSKRDRNERENLIRRFRFPKTQRCGYKKIDPEHEKVVFSCNPGMTYIMPLTSNGKGGVKRQKYLEEYLEGSLPAPDPSNPGPYLFAAWNYYHIPGTEKYTLSFIINIFATWDSILFKHINHSDERQEKTFFACEPDFLKCWILLCDALNLDTEIEEIKNLCNKYSYSELQRNSREIITKKRINECYMPWLGIYPSRKESKESKEKKDKREPQSVEFGPDL